MARQTNPPLGALSGFIVVGLAAVGLLLWHLRVQTIDQEIARKRSSLAKLHLREALPPNQQVLDHLKARTASLEKQYQTALQMAAPMPTSTEAQADPQLLFQQRVHEVQRTLERLSAARGMKMPDQLGFPKELPPPDAVPRFLVQVGFIEELAELLMRLPGVLQIASFKIEDPQAVLTTAQAQEGFLNRLPIRTRLVCSLEALIAVMGILDRARPLMDLEVFRMTAPPDSEELEVEFVLARYMVVAGQPDQSEEKPSKAPGRKKGS